MSFGKQLNIVSNEPEHNSVDSHTTAFFKQESETPCSQSASGSIKTSYQETPPDDQGKPSLNDSFCGPATKRKVAIEAHQQLKQQDCKYTVLIPIHSEDGNITFITDKFDTLTLPMAMGEFEDCEALVMTIQVEDCPHYNEIRRVESLLLQEECDYEAQEQQLQYQQELEEEFQEGEQQLQQDRFQRRSYRSCNDESDM